MIVPQKYVSAAFGFDLPWKPGYLRPTTAPKNITDLGRKLLGPNSSLSVGQSYKDFYVKTD